VTATYWTWSRMSPEQRQAATAAQVASGAGRGDGMPPSGPHSVFWVALGDGTWCWRSAIWPHAVDQGGVAIGSARPEGLRSGIAVEVSAEPTAAPKRKAGR
jgi:hypothetical protein